MTRGALVGLAAIVLMVTEPWWGRLLTYRPPTRPAPPPDPVRAQLLRPGWDPGRELEPPGGGS